MYVVGDAAFQCWGCCQLELASNTNNILNLTSKGYDLSKFRFLRFDICREQCTYETDKQLTGGMSKSIVTGVTPTAKIARSKEIMLYSAMHVQKQRVHEFPHAHIYVGEQK